MLLEADNKFQISIPLSARMAAASGSEARANENKLPLTVREGRKFLLDRQEISEQDTGTVDVRPADLNVGEIVLSARDIWFRYEKDAQIGRASCRERV